MKEKIGEKKNFKTIYVENDLDRSQFIIFSLILKV